MEDKLFIFLVTILLMIIGILIGALIIEIHNQINESK
jgi:uncharacterized membrane-anchored protein YhcB (DUF1043 family)